MTITEQNSHFVQGSTTADFGSGITVTSLFVTGPTTATVTINIDPAAGVGPHNVTITTGSETATGSNLFTVQISTIWLSLAQTGLPSQSEFLGIPSGVSPYRTSTNRMVTLDYTQGNSPWVLTNANGLAGTPTWVSLPTNSPGFPAGRYLFSQTFDDSNNRLILFGGSVAGGYFYNDVWVLANADGTNGQGVWTQLNPAGTPPSPRRFSSTVYDASSNRMIVFGGCLCEGDETASWLSDVWVLTNANGMGSMQPTWIELSPFPALPPGHPPTTAVYDPLTNRLIIFGGGNGTAPYSNDVWVLTNANGLGGSPAWQSVIPNGSPGAPLVRQETFTFYNSTNNHLTVFGGGTLARTDDDGDATKEVWVLSNANGTGGAPFWTQLSPTGEPPALAGFIFSNGVYDSGHDRIIIAQPSGLWALTNPTDLSSATTALLSVTPFSGSPGDSLTVTLTGQLSHFMQGTSVLSMGPNISVGGAPYGSPGPITVINPTTATATIRTNSLASIGTQPAVVTTGSEQAAQPSAFNIYPAGLAPQITSVSPASAAQGVTITVAITGLYTHFAQAGTQVTAGAGVTVTSVSVSDSAHITAQLTVDPAAAIGPRTITATTSTETVSAVNPTFAPGGPFRLFSA